MIVCPPPGPQVAAAPLSALVALHLVLRGPRDGTRAVHRAVQTAVDERVPPSHKLRARLVRFLRRRFDFDDKKADRAAEREHEAHAAAVLRSGAAPAPCALEAAKLCNELGMWYEYCARFEEALVWSEWARASFVHLRGRSDATVGHVLNNIGGVHKRLGQYDAALSAYKEALRIYKTTVGDGHPDYAAILQNVAGVRHSKGQHDRACADYVRALAIISTKLGERHVRVADTRHNLGLVYAALGRHADALDAYMEALAIYGTSLPHDHPTVGGTLIYLARAHLALGQRGQARTHAARALAIFAARLGEEHFETVAARRVMDELAM